MLDNQTEVISNWENLIINSFFHMHSSIPMKHKRNCNSIHSILPFQSLPKKAHSQSHTRNNHRRNNSQSSILLVSHNSSNRNDVFYQFHLCQHHRGISQSTSFQSPLFPIHSIQSISILLSSENTDHPLSTPSSSQTHSNPLLSLPLLCSNYHSPQSPQPSSHQFSPNHSCM